ncbi:hypothetical protein A2U01_0046129, partial [Trifolium medium]|nr:hypothetical protein [Trifolium medium]
ETRKCVCYVFFLLMQHKYCLSFPSVYAAAVSIPTAEFFLPFAPYTASLSHCLAAVLQIM